MLSFVYLQSELANFWFSYYYKL